MKNKKMMWIIFTVLLSRTILALFAQGAVSWRAEISFLEAGKWWTVYGSLIDIGCLALLIWVVKREGANLRLLIGFSPGKLKNDIKMAIIILVVLIPLTALWGTLISFLLYGKASVPIIAGPLPLWAALYSVFIWPILWAIVEQLIYMGYCLPRLESFLKNKVTAVAIVMFFWALQHTVLPVTLDMDYSLYRFLTVFPMVIIPIVYLRTRRLVPLILVHAIGDIFSAITFYFLPMS